VGVAGGSIASFKNRTIFVSQNFGAAALFLKTPPSSAPRQALPPTPGTWPGLLRR
jgi:hypothetical protein